MLYGVHIVLYIHTSNPEYTQSTACGVKECYCCHPRRTPIREHVHSIASTALRASMQTTPSSSGATRACARHPWSTTEIPPQACQTGCSPATARQHNAAPAQQQHSTSTSSSTSIHTKHARPADDHMSSHMQPACLYLEILPACRLGKSLDQHSIPCAPATHVGWGRRGALGTSSVLHAQAVAMVVVPITATYRILCIAVRLLGVVLLGFIMMIMIRQLRTDCLQTPGMQRQEASWAF